MKGIIEALIQHRTARISIANHCSVASKDTLSENEDHPLCNVSGGSIATHFANAFERLLTSEEHNKLLAFLRELPPLPTSNVPLRQVVKDMIQRFYNEEVSTSKWDTDRFCIPSGREDAELMLILHCQTKKATLPVRDFWDLSTFTIQKLGAKGYDPDFCYGYDWHWRAEETCVGRGTCSTRTWPPAVKTLHDSISSSLFKKLPSRFALIAGTCTRQHVQKMLDSSPDFYRCNVAVALNGTKEPGVEFDLVFKNGNLCRINTYIPHPSAVWWDNQDSRTSSSALIDAGSNFVLWLLGKPYHSTTMQEQKAIVGSYQFNQAPMSDLKWYMALERKEHKILDETEYHFGFLHWAKNYLGHDFDTIVREKRSVAGACQEKLTKNAWTARIIKHLKERQPVDKKRKHDTPNNQPMKRPMIAANHPEPSKEEFSNKSLDEGEFRRVQAQINREVAQKRFSTLESQELWDGRTVKMSSNGNVVLRVPWKEGPLRLYTRPEAQAIIKQSGLSPTIHFFSDKIILKVANEVVETRPTVYMHHAREGRDWHTQNERELQAKGCLDQLSDKKQASSTGTNGDQPISRQSGPNAERRERFLQGRMVHCGRRKEDQYGRITLRGSLYVLVPRHADLNHVWVQCELLEGAEHPKTCAENAPQGDPCKRLGVHVRYRSKNTNEAEEFWYQTKSDLNMKKINSFVDFLEGKSEEFTINQSRRVPLKNAGRKEQKSR